MSNDNQNVEIFGIEVPKVMLLTTAISLAVYVMRKQPQLPQKSELALSLVEIESKTGIQPNVMRDFILYVSGFNPACHYNEYADGKVRQFNDLREVNEFTVCGGLAGLSLNAVVAAFGRNNIVHLSSALAMKAYLQMTVVEQLGFASSYYSNFKSLDGISALADLADNAFSAANENYFKRYIASKLEKAQAQQ